MKRQKQIDLIMDGFDFGRCLVIMRALNWRYRMDEHVPELQEVRETALSLLEDVRHEHKIASSGGFTALRLRGRINLHFGVDSWVLTDCAE
jgi:hypothetical protein